MLLQESKKIEKAPDLGVGGSGRLGVFRASGCNVVDGLDFVVLVWGLGRV